MSFDGVSSFLVDKPEDASTSGVESIPYYSFSGGITSQSDFLTKTANPTGSLGNENATSTPVVQSFDLSDFGIAPGGSISSIYLQDRTTGNDFFPTMVLGLPGVPEPSTFALLATGGCAMLLLLFRGRRGRASLAMIRVRSR
jgi:PEP-CTERM motif